MGMKRCREEGEMTSMSTMAKCLMLLSRAGHREESIFQSPSRVFECKTCNRQFPSFQALGGHRASHKKPRTKGEDVDSENKNQIEMKPKTHECSICGLEFAIGQALGGHMRRHRNMNSDDLSHSAISMQGQTIMKSNTKRIFSLDLNLTPSENDLNLQIANILSKKLSPPLVI